MITGVSPVLALKVLGLSVATTLLPVTSALAADTTADDLATKGLPYFMAVVVIVLAAGIVKKDTQHRQDLKEQSEKHRLELKDLDKKYYDTLVNMNSALQRLIADNTAAMVLLQRSNESLTDSIQQLNQSVGKCHTVHSEMKELLKRP